MGSIFGLDKLFPQIFGNNLLIYGLIALIIIVGYFLLRKGETKQNMKMFYFAEVERLVTPLIVKDLTPKSVETTDEKRFMRRAKSWLWKEKSKSFVIWLGKVGRGITYRLETNKKDKKGNTVVEKIGSLLDGVRNCLQLKDDEVITKDTFTDENLKKLNLSEIFVCVDLEPETEDMPEITEEGATTEADNNIMDLIGLKVKEHFSKEDWIRNGGLMAIGIVAWELAHMLGLL